MRFEHPSELGRTSQRLDQLGIGLAALCLAHCLATVAFVSFIGIGAHVLLAPEFHRIGLTLALVIATFAIGWGFSKHRQKTPFFIATIGLLFMGGAIVGPHGSQEIVLTVIGVALLSVGHFLNLRASQS